MSKLIATAALAVVLIAGAAADAEAWTRSGTWSGPRGTASVHAAESCAGGTCSRQITRTGPYGGSVTRQGSASCSSGTCTGTRTTTGPYGGTVTRQRTISRD
ncbi:hypothetical protein [Rhodoplanes roseus]|uniref:hypothetical protein n=1 Tax=Rhodoplanes roseus TaxID=29409 RepID=UPI001FE1DD7A|nr:hypothetical protein [Rhodoplanes roseus]